MNRRCSTARGLVTPPDSLASVSASPELDWREASGTPYPRSPGERRINLDPDDLKNGLAQLVLTVIKLLHELMEKQAIRRIESGLLTEADCERIGFTLMKQSEQMEKLRQAFGLSDEDLNIDLGPLGRLL
jgi:gas vesicle protein GvpK